MHPRESQTWRAPHRSDIEFGWARFPTSGGNHAWIRKPVRLQPAGFYKPYERMGEAIAREKQIKAGSRAKKIALIESVNPEWRDRTEASPRVVGWIASPSARNDGLAATQAHVTIAGSLGA
jgi:hypothetical protein